MQLGPLYSGSGKFARPYYHAFRNTVRNSLQWVGSFNHPLSLYLALHAHPLPLAQARTFKVAEAAAYESLNKRLRSLAGGPDGRDGRKGGGAGGSQPPPPPQQQGGQQGQGQAHGHGLKNGGGGGGGGGGGRHGGRGRRHTRGSHDGTGGAEGKDWRDGREGQGEGGEAEMRRRYVRLLAPPPRAPPAVPRG